MDTYIKVKVYESEKGIYTRKGVVVVNVLAACDINQNFIHILTRSEGSVADCRTTAIILYVTMIMQMGMDFLLYTRDIESWLDEMKLEDEDDSSVELIDTVEPLQPWINFRDNRDSNYH
ncbi:hypothetical protein BUALT_Bualt02G0049300 [Buddleja alternifolia]|uniref:Uncharacterized protein n=1 Tax=Buddleja alternifolia TaxID=168488 RepID=A0AAV6XZ34_9LAMI|nr:hypothetical protein BUALT_Bualt02G0049300 [Buddleja alternifolia]